MGKLARNAFDPKAFLAIVGTGKTILKFEKNQHVFEQGDVADSVFYLQRGQVKLTVVSEQGKEAVVGILEPGQFFGEGCLNGHPLRIATTTAMEESVITSITKEAMIATLRTQPKFSELFMAYLLTRNSRIEEDLIDQLFNSSEKRLARLLLLLAHFGEEGRSQSILLNISQETLAEMIGTTRSRVSAFMNKFRKLGLISYNGKIEVHNSLLNAVLREKPEIERDDSSARTNRPTGCSMSGFSQSPCIRDFRCWHRAAEPGCPLDGRFRGESGHDVNSRIRSRINQLRHGRVRRNCLSSVST